MPLRTLISTATALSLVQGRRALARTITTWTGDDANRSGSRAAPVDDLIRTTAQLATTVASRRHERDETRELIRDVAGVATAVAFLVHHRWARRLAPPVASAEQPGSGC